jgi:hypothetical protein
MEALSSKGFDSFNARKEPYFFVMKGKDSPFNRNI